jgi:hypothetical protein
MSGSLSIQSILQTTYHIKLGAEATIEKALCNRGLANGALPAQTLLIRTCDRCWSEPRKPKFVLSTLSEPLATRPVAGGIARRLWRSFSGRRSVVCRCKAVLDNNSTPTMYLVRRLCWQQEHHPTNLQNLFCRLFFELPVVCIVIIPYCSVFCTSSRQGLFL